LDSKRAFFRIESHVVFMGLFEHPPEISGMINLLLRFDDHVVYLNLKNVAHKFFVVDFIHHSLISSPHISKTKGHYVVVIVPRFNHESYFLFIFVSYGYLVVTRIGIQEG
jgi:hypothetical protein